MARLKNSDNKDSNKCNKWLPETTKNHLQEKKVG